MQVGAAARPQVSLHCSTSVWAQQEARPRCEWCCLRGRCASLAALGTGELNSFQFQGGLCQLLQCRLLNRHTHVVGDNHKGVVSLGVTQLNALVCSSLEWCFSVTLALRPQRRRAEGQRPASPPGCALEAVVRLVGRGRGRPVLAGSAAGRHTEVRHPHTTPAGEHG